MGICVKVLFNCNRRINVSCAICRKQAELLERLTAYYSKNTGQKEGSDVGRDAVDRRKSVDSMTTISMHTAVTTPLPPHPKHKRSSLEGQSSNAGSRKKKAVPDRVKAGGTRAGVPWGKVALLLVVSGIAMALVPYCREHRCADEALEKVKSIEWSQLMKGSEWMKSRTWMMGQWEKVSSMAMWGNVKEAYDGALAKGRYIYHVSKVHARLVADKIKDLLADGIERMQHMVSTSGCMHVFFMMIIHANVLLISLLVQLEDKTVLEGQSTVNKKLTQLNSAVLESITGNLKDSSWGSVKSSIEDIWALEKIAETKVGNLLIIVCFVF